MEAIVERCCGLDVHQAVVVACLIVGTATGKPRKEVRSFSTMTDDLERLREWLSSEGCTHVGMESTGVYWMQVYAMLEGHFRLVVGNAMHIRNVPGRKILETANIKLASVASNVFGVSGRLMLRALLDGNATPEQMAQLAKGRLRHKEALLARALTGRVEEHHRFILSMQLERLEQIEASIAKLDLRIDEKLEPYRVEHTRLMQIPVVDRVGAAVIIAELGVDMSIFPTAQHAAAWAGVCPGNNESAGKQRGAAKRKGNVHLTTALVQAAVCAGRKRGSYLKDKFWRLKARRGPKRAAMAIAHKILIAAYHMLARTADYKDLGAEHLDRVNQTQIKRNLVRRLERLGYRVSLEAAA